MHLKNIQPGIINKFMEYKNSPIMPKAYYYVIMLYKATLP